MEQTVATMGDADRSAMERPEMQEWYVEMMRESFRQGGRAAHEAALYQQAWGFDPEQVTVETRLW